jgi:hypothetical protein
VTPGQGRTCGQTRAGPPGQPDQPVGTDQAGRPRPTPPRAGSTAAGERSGTGIDAEPRTPTAESGSCGLDRAPDAGVTESEQGRRDARDALSHRRRRASWHAGPRSTWWGSLPTWAAVRSCWPATMAASPPSAGWPGATVAKAAMTGLALAAMAYSRALGEQLIQAGGYAGRRRNHVNSNRARPSAAAANGAAVGDSGADRGAAGARINALSAPFRQLEPAQL